MLADIQADRNLSIPPPYNNEYYCTPSPTLINYSTKAQKTTFTLVKAFGSPWPVIVDHQFRNSRRAQPISSRRSRRSFRPESLPLSIPYDLHCFSQYLSPRRSRWPTPHWLLVLPSEPDHDRDPPPRRLRLAPVRRRSEGECTRE